MTARILPEAREDLREAVRYYRSIRPPALGRQLAERVLAAFRDATRQITESPLARPEHPDIPGARFVQLQSFPYLVFYAVGERTVIIVSVEYATRDYVARITGRMV
jgi:plasmid stabilization system protein ParE